MRPWLTDESWLIIVLWISRVSMKELMFGKLSLLCRCDVLDLSML
jgi:hypothetical protein